MRDQTNSYGMQHLTPLPILTLKLPPEGFDTLDEVEENRFILLAKLANLDTLPKLAPCRLLPPPGVGRAPIGRPKVTTLP